MDPPIGPPVRLNPSASASSSRQHGNTPLALCSSRRSDFDRNNADPQHPSHSVYFRPPQHPSGPPHNAAGPLTFNRPAQPTSNSSNDLSGLSHRASEHPQQQQTPARPPNMMAQEHFLPPTSQYGSTGPWVDSNFQSSSSLMPHHLLYCPAQTEGENDKGDSRSASRHAPPGAGNNWSPDSITSIPHRNSFPSSITPVPVGAPTAVLGKRPTFDSPIISTARSPSSPVLGESVSHHSSHANADDTSKKPNMTSTYSSRGPAPHTHLKKQQACLTCKRRKTRCDAVRPICGACARSQARAARGHALTAEVPPGPCCYPEDDQQPLHAPAASGCRSNDHPSANHSNKKAKTSPFEKASTDNLAPYSTVLRQVSSSQSRTDLSPVTNLVPRGSVSSPFSDPHSFGGSPGSQQDSKGMSPSTTGTSFSGPGSAEMEHATLSFESSARQLLTDLSAVGGTANDSSVKLSRIMQSAGSGAAEDTAAGGSPQTKRFIIEVQSGSGGRARIQRYYKRDPARTATGEHPGMNLSNLMHPMMSTTDGLQDDPVMSHNGTDMQPDAEWANVNSSDLPQVDLMLRQLWPELSPDLPTPDTIRHMGELFFSKHPCRNMFCKETMMARLMLPPGHTLRPHPALIHALLAAAEPFSPLVPSMKDTNPLARGDNDQAGFQEPATGGTWADAYGVRSTQIDTDAVEAAGRGLPCISNPMEMPRPEISARNLSFGEFHLGKARREIEIAALTQNQRPLEWVQASVLIAYCLLERCRIMELFFLAAAMVRTVAPVGLDRMPNDLASPDWGKSLCGLPENSIAHYEQRMTMWHIYVLDSYAGGPPNWYAPCIGDEGSSVTTTMPVVMHDVRDDTRVQLSEQTLSSSDLFRRGHSDTFMLHVKSACLLKRVRTLTSRKGSELQRMARPSQEVLQLDTWAKELLSSFLKRQGHDVDWIVAEANTCVARITLHSYYINLDRLNTDAPGNRGPDGEFGLEPIMACGEMMLRTVHDLLASSFDLNLLHTQTFICWTVLVRALEVQMRTLSKIPTLHEQAQQAQGAIQSVLAALSKAAEKSTRAKTSLDICRAIYETEMTDDEFGDLVFLWQVIPAV